MRVSSDRCPLEARDEFASDTAFFRMPINSKRLLAHRCHHCPEYDGDLQTSCLRYQSPSVTTVQTNEPPSKRGVKCHCTDPSLGIAKCHCTDTSLGIANTTILLPPTN